MKVFDNVMWHDFDEDKVKVLRDCLNCKHNEAWLSKWHSMTIDRDKLECCQCGEVVWIQTSDNKPEGEEP